VTGGWRKLHNEELHNLYPSPSIVRIMKTRRMRWTWNVAHMEERRNAHMILVGKPEGKRQLGRPRHRWEDNITVGCGNVDWIDLTEDRDQWRALVNKVMSLRFHKMLENS
jgi:hypothetical protein